jgi:hypothetical protein
MNTLDTHPRGLLLGVILVERLGDGVVSSASTARVSNSYAHFFGDGGAGLM